MMETVFHAVLFFFALLGLCAVLSLLFDLLFFTGRKPVDDLTVIVAVGERRGGTEYAVRSLCRRLEDYPTPRGRGRVVLVAGADGEARRLCEKLAAELDGVEVATDCVPAEKSI